MTLKFWQSPHFQNCNFEKGKCFWSKAPLKRGQVCKKWSSRRADRFGKRWAIFIFPSKMIQRGDHWMIYFLTEWKLQFFNFLLVSHLFSSEYDRPSTQKRFLCISKHIKGLFKYYVTFINIQLTTGMMLYYGKTITLKWKRKDFGGPVKSSRVLGFQNNV